MQFGASESIQHWGKYRPASPAVIHNGNVTTYGELNTAVNALCSEIMKVHSGSDRIAVAIRSRFRLLIAMIAVLRTGKSVVCLNSGLDDDALRVNLREAKVWFLIHDKENERIQRLIQSAHTINIDLLTDSQIGAVGSAPREPRDEWGVLFSSGTTGIPKGIERDQESMVTEFVGWCLELGLTRQTCFYVGRPIYYTGGLVLAFSTMLVGGHVILNDYADDNDVREAWEDYQRTLSSRAVNWAFFVPNQIRGFCDIVAAEGSAPLKADSILIMGAAISGEEKTQAWRLLQSNVIESWGNSESLGTITDPEDIQKRPKSIGRPFVTDELYILDDDRLTKLGPNEKGIIAGNDDAGFLRYCSRPEDTSLAKQNKLIISEDIGYTDDDGFFYVSGRQQDRIVIGDDTVFLTDIESKLRKHPLVKDCCVAPKEPDQVKVELVGVIVVADPLKVSETDFLQQLNALVSPSEQLVHILFLDKIPSVGSGKTDRVKVAALVKERL
jgi:acyl-coenzyme A synthetase/AMP-(fatty) acid ligase